MAIYNGFDDPNLPAVEDLDATSDEVHAGGRKWKWDGTKWTLYSEGSINGIQFEAEIPVYRKLEPSDTNPDEEIKVTHFFDMNDLTPLDTP